LGHEDFSQPALSMGPQDSKSQARGGLARSRWLAGGVRVFLAAWTDMDQTGLNVGVGDPFEFVPSRADRTEGGEALLGVLSVQLQMPPEQRFEHLPVLAAQRPLVQQD